LAGKLEYPLNYRVRAITAHMAYGEIFLHSKNDPWIKIILKLKIYLRTAPQAL
jgi:hypothetical protein